ncbi:hypothetical protein B9Z19DRAFT_802376 [Tuber borchii]|uniref:Secreted protein n=1 Tax=Tuber borchii TaxID=42251 RepID=A0A2T6ZVY6_TUBBO|nr:hypothetical protein B9Z19DRAFT_802376 [Tuber borchii]
MLRNCFLHLSLLSFFSWITLPSTSTRRESLARNWLLDDRFSLLFGPPVCGIPVSPSVAFSSLFFFTGFTRLGLKQGRSPFGGSVLQHRTANNTQGEPFVEKGKKIDQLNKHSLCKQ